MIIPDSIFDCEAATAGFVDSFSVSMTALLQPNLFGLEEREACLRSPSALARLFPRPTTSGCPLGRLSPTSFRLVLVRRLPSPARFPSASPVADPSDVLLTLSDDDTPARRTVGPLASTAVLGSVRETLIDLIRIDRADTVLAFEEKMSGIAPARPLIS
jgi:hypothetical protein